MPVFPLVFLRALVKNQGLGAITLSQTNPVRGVNFNIHYQGEDLSDEGTVYVYISFKWKNV